MRSRTSWRAATTVVGAAATFAPTSFARLRLIRQLHACGLLSLDEQPGDPVCEVAATARRDRASGSVVDAC